MVFNAIIFDRITQCRMEPLIITTEPAEVEVKKELLSDSDSDSDSEEVLNLPSHFISTVKPHNISSRSYFHVPAGFARSSGLLNRNCEITLKDDKENIWHMNLKSTEGDTRIQNGSKVSEFLTANGFKIGDSYKFELLAIGNGDDESPVVVKITPQKMEVNVSESEDVVVSESGDDEYPYFTHTIKKYSMSKKGTLNIPMKFGRSNGLFRKEEVILMGKGGRRWPVKLSHDYWHLSINNNGWKDFRDANGIKEGDEFKFEIVENGAVPVVRFTVMVPGTVGSS